MDEHVYRVIELAGSSTKSVSDAIETAISRANQTLRGLRWFEVVQTRGQISKGKVKEYQVVLKVGFLLEGADPD